MSRLLVTTLAALGLWMAAAFAQGVPSPPPGPQPVVCAGGNSFTGYTSYGALPTCGSPVASGTINTGTVGQFGVYAAANTIGPITSGGAALDSLAGFGGGALGLIQRTGAGAYSFTVPGAGILTFLATPNSANLLAALGDATGTGAAVFGTSPSLATPTIAGATLTGTLAGTPTYSGVPIYSGLSAGTVVSAGWLGLDSGNHLVKGTPPGAYSAPTLGSTLIPSGATVTTLAGLTLTAPTINSAALSGTLSGNFTLSGVPSLTGLSTGTIATCAGFATASTTLISGTCPGSGGGSPGGSTGALQTNGGGGSFAGLAGIADQVALATAPNTWVGATLPSCLDTSGQHLNYNTSTHAFSCGTSSSGGSGTPAFFAATAVTTHSGTGPTAYTVAATTPTPFAATNGFTVQATFDVTNPVHASGNDTATIDGVGPVNICAQTQDGIAATIGGEIPALTVMSLVYNAANTCLVLSTPVAGGTNTTTGTVAPTPAEWAHGELYNGATEIDLPASSVVTTKGGISIQSGSSPMILKPNGSDLLNGINASTTIPAYTLVQVSTDGSTKMFAPNLGVQPVVQDTTSHTMVAADVGVCHQATAASVTYTFPAASATQGTAGSNGQAYCILYDGTHSYSVSSGGGNFYGPGVSAGTTISAMASNIVVESDGAATAGWAVSGVGVAAGVSSVSGTAPIASSGGATPAISMGGPSNLTTFTAGTVPMGATASPFAASEITDAGSAGVIVGSPTGGQKGAGTFNANGVYDTGARVLSGTALPNGTTATTQTGGDNTTKVATDQFVQTAVAGASGAVAQGSIAGLTLSNDGTTPNSVLDIASGQAADRTGAVYIALASAFTKSTAGAWASGSGSNGMGNGLTIAASTWYDVCLAYNGGTADVWFDTATTTPSQVCGNPPAGVATNTQLRRIGAFKTDGSANIIAFKQTPYRPSITWWATATLDVNTATLGTTAALETLNVPIGVNVEPICRTTIGGTGASVVLTSPDETDVAPGTATPFSAAPGFDQLDTNLTSGEQNANCPFITTNPSGQVRARASAASTTLALVTRGWRDPLIPVAAAIGGTLSTGTGAADCLATGTGASDCLEAN